MVSTFRQFFQTPVLVDEDLNSKGRTLNVVLNVWLLLLPAFSLNLLFFPVDENRDPLFQAMLALNCLLLIVFRHLLRAGRVAEVGTGLLVMLWTIVTFGVALIGTVRAPISGFYITLVVIAAVVKGARGMWLMVAVSALTYGALVLAQIVDVLPGAVQTVRMGVWISLSLILVATAAFLGMALRLRDDGLARARQALIDRDRAENAEAANKAKSMFLARMSHELRTPLHGILGYSEMLSQDVKHPEQKEFAQIIHGAGTHLLSLVNGILDLAKIEAGRMELSMSEVALPPLVQELARLHRQAAQSKGLTLLVDMDADLPETLRTDAMRFREIVNNLLGNAVKYTDSGNIILHLRRQNGGVEVRVHDTGKGIGALDLQQLFQPFRQLDRGEAQGGSGLGLAITKDLTELLGGTITVESRPGKGTTFTVWHPVSE